MRMEAQKGQDSFKSTELQLDKTSVVDGSIQHRAL